MVWAGVWKSGNDFSSKSQLAQALYVVVTIPEVLQEKKTTHCKLLTVLVVGIQLMFVDIDCPTDAVAHPVEGD